MRIGCLRVSLRLVMPPVSVDEIAEFHLGTWLERECFRPNTFAIIALHRMFSCVPVVETSNNAGTVRRFLQRKLEGYTYGASLGTGLFENHEIGEGYDVPAYAKNSILIQCVSACRIVGIWIFYASRTLAARDSQELQKARMDARNRKYNLLMNAGLMLAFAI